MLLRIFYQDSYRDLPVNQVNNTTVGSDPGDTVCLPCPSLKPGHLLLRRESGRVSLKSRESVMFQGAAVKSAVLTPGSAVGVSREDNVSIFGCSDEPERPLAVRVDDLNEVSVGSADFNTIVIHSRFVSKKHLTLVRQGTSFLLRDERSTNGSYVNGRRVRQKELRGGEEIVLGDVRMRLAGWDLEIWYAGEVKVRGRKGAGQNQNGAVMFTRSPRLKLEPPKKLVEIEAPPPQEKKPEVNWLQTLIPTLVTVGVSMLSAVVMQNSKMLLFTLPMTVTGVILSVHNYKKNNKKFEEQSALRLKKYNEHLKKAETELIDCRERQLEALNAADPPTEQCVSMARGLDRRLWQRSPGDEDFASVRLGTGSVPLSTEIRFPRVTLSLEEDELRRRPQELHDKYCTVNGAPITLSIFREQVCGVVGPHREALELISRMLIQLCFTHCYTELKLVLVCDEADRRALSWAEKLPHMQDEEGAVLIADDKESAGELFRSFSEMLRGRKAELAENDSFGDTPMLLPFYLFVILQPAFLEKSNPVTEYLFRSADLCVGTIMAVEQVSRLPQSCNSIIEVWQGGGDVYNKNNAAARQRFTPDKCGESFRTEFGRALEHVRCEAESGKASIPKKFGFYEMLGIRSASEWDVGAHWAEADITKAVSAPLGIGQDGLLELDLHERGHGPHGLVAGTTGSGKSEVLQSYLMSLALRYPPQELGFVIIDFKGGGMANQFEGLPHLIGAITNIEGREIRRSLASIRAELLKRQRLFADVGVNSIDKYIERYRAGQAPVPVPHLLIVVDEFAELKAQQPEFMDELISAARIGRSLGVHLILATQKPAGQVNDQIWSNSRFRICLKVASAEDSREMLKNPLAYSIKEPGRAYLQVGNDEIFELFQSGYSGGPAEDAPGLTQLQAMARRVAAYCQDKGIRSLPPICLPPLPDELPLPAPAPGCAPGTVLLGLQDDPEQQLQDAVGVDLTRSNLIAVGTTQTGKTNLIQSFIHQLAESMSPEQVNMYIIDPGAMTLRVFEPLCHVGGVVAGIDPERLKNLFKLLLGEMERRKQLFSRIGVSSYRSYTESGESLPLIVVFLDNYSIFKEVFDEGYEETLLRLLREGLSYGLSFVITNPLTAGLSYKLLTSFSERVCFACNDSGDYGYLLDGCRTEPKNVPGRALIQRSKVNYEVQTYRGFDGASESARSMAIRSFISACSEKYPGMEAKAIPGVPERVDRAWLVQTYPELRVERELAIGVDYAGVDCLKLDCVDQFMLGLAGRNQAQKESFLRAVLEDLRINYFRRPVRLYILDSFEKKLGDYRDEIFVRKYSAAAESMGEILEEIRDDLRDRSRDLEDGEGQPLEKQDWIVVVVNNKRALDYLNDSRDAEDCFNDIFRKYRSMKVLFLLSELDDATIGASSPLICRKMRDEKKLLYFGALKELRILDVYGSAARQAGDPASAEDAYFFDREDIIRIKAIQEG